MPSRVSFMRSATKATASSCLGHTGVSQSLLTIYNDRAHQATVGFERIARARQNVKIVVARPPTYHNFDNYLLPSIQAAYDFAADKSKIRAVLICNPNNPASRCYTRKSLIECMEFCQERGLHFISDEIYALTALDDTPSNSAKFVSALSLTEPLVPEGAVKIDPSRVHVIWAASKLFGSSGFRIVSSPMNLKLPS